MRFKTQSDETIIFDNGIIINKKLMNVAEKVTVSRRSELFLTRQLLIFMYRGSSIFLSAASVFMVLFDCAFHSTLHLVPDVS